MAPEKTFHFADLLRRARVAAGLTQEELAEAAKISVRAVSNLERGVNRAPHRYTRELLADALQLSDDVRAEWAASTRRTGRRTDHPLGSSRELPGQDYLHDLPVPQTPLLGRESDIAFVVERLRTPSVRLATLTGPGGVGKTRLALAVADELVDTYPESVHVVGLASLRDPQLVVSAIATVLGVRDAGERSLQAALIAALGSKRLLLVLDNFEHVLDASPLVACLLANCPKLTVLVTSRAPLRLHGEHEIAIPPLSVPEKVEAPPRALLQSSAVELFVARAQRVRADFALTEGNAADVGEICRRLEGLPLAIELAAARVKLLTPHALLTRLERPLALLRDGARDAPARQQTIRQTIAWSYELLTPDEQRLLRQLSVFVGGWTLEAAEDVCDPGLDVLTGMDALLDHSLVKSWEQSDGSMRFRMLETIREFAAEQLTANGEVGRIRDQHATYFTQLAEEARPALKGGLEQRQRLGQLESELENLRAALSFLVGEEDAEKAHRLVTALDEFWFLRALHQEGCQWLRKVVSLPGQVSPNLRADIFKILGVMLREIGEYDEGEQYNERAIELYQQTNNLAGLADTYCHAGGLAMYQGNYERAAYLEELALGIARRENDSPRIAHALGALSIIAMIDADFHRAEALATEFLHITSEIGDQYSRGVAVGYLGYIALWQNNLESAERWAQECTISARSLGDIGWLTFGLELLGYIELERDEYHKAEQYFCESLRGVWGRREVMTTAECLEGLAGTAAGIGDSKRAARLLGAADSLRERVGTPLPPPRVDRYERTVAAIRQRLSDAGFETMKSEGYSWPLEQAIDYALEETPVTLQGVQPSPAPLADLSKREIEVLRLLVEGLSDREIAERLFISHHTAMRHVSNILRKLDVNSRTAAAAWAVRNGLVEVQ